MTVLLRKNCGWSVSYVKIQHMLGFIREPSPTASYPLWHPIPTLEERSHLKHPKHPKGNGRRMRAAVVHHFFFNKKRSLLAIQVQGSLREFRGHILGFGHSPSPPAAREGPTQPRMTRIASSCVMLPMVARPAVPPVPSC